MSNEFSKFEKELSLLFSKKFFFKDPTNNKIILYTFLYFVTNLFGSFFDLWYITTLFSTFYLCYLLGAKGYKYIFLVSILSIASCFVFGNVYSILWLIIHCFIVIIIYLSLINRFPKLLLVLYVSVFLFFSTAIFLFVLIRIGYVNYNPENIKLFFDNYINSVMELQPNTDYNILTAGVDYVKIHIPTILYLYLLLYTLLLLQNTLTLLSREKVIIPVFPLFSKVIVRKELAIFYVLFLFLQYLVEYVNVYDTFSFVPIFLENLASLLRWIFVLNGLFTFYFFVEQKNKGEAILTKVILFVGMFFVGFIFELVGIADSIFKIRQSYLHYKGGK